MDINLGSKIKEILAKYPQIKSKLAEISPKFKFAGSFLGKLFSNDTVESIAKKINIDQIGRAHV